MFFTLTNQQHYSTAPGSLKTFFSLKTNSITSQLLVFLSFYNHSPDFQLEIHSLSDHKPPALPHSFWFFLLREFYPGVFRYKTLLYSQAISTTVQLLVFLKKVFSFKYKPSALSHSFWFSQTFYSQTTGTTTQLLVFYKFTCSQIISTTVQHPSFWKKFFLTPTALQYSFWFFFEKKAFFY